MVVRKIKCWKLGRSNQKDYSGILGGQSLLIRFDHKSITIVFIDLINAMQLSGPQGTWFWSGDLDLFGSIKMGSVHEKGKLHRS